MGPRRRLASTFGPAAIAGIGLVAIAVGASIKSGFIQVRRGSFATDSVLTVKTGAGDVALPTAPNDTSSALAKRAAPQTPRELTVDTILPPTVTIDSNAVLPTSAELAELASALIVPVAGVQPKDLLDTFDEARGTRRHNALDILAPRGTPVLSAADGQVRRVFTSAAGGLMVYASDPSDRFVLMYAHLDRYADGLVDGKPLKRGETIGYVGTTGNAPPNVPHLHFAIARTADASRWWTGLPIDPRPLLQR